ncbi:hypothetical protein N8386_04255, partial [Planktomarina temperata]|nr:hypothetical protein [Planktomarina temperata]
HSPKQYIVTKFLYTIRTQNIDVDLTNPMLSFVRTNGSSLKMSYGVNSIQIHKKLRLDKRAGSDNWYARLTLPSGKRLIKTTKTDDLEAAKEVALRLYYEVDARIQNKLPATTRKFSDVAKYAIARMETEIREGVGKQAYRDYVQALNKWLIPYFGTTDVAKLDLAAVTAFDAWRTAQVRLILKLSRE